MRKYIYPIAILNKLKLPTWLRYYTLKDTLPTAYQQVEYIEGNNSGYIPTDLKLKGTDTVKFTYKTPETGSTVCCVFGSYKSGENENFSLYSAGASSYGYWRYAGSLYQNVKFINDTKFDITFSGDKIIVNDDTYNTEFTIDSFTTLNNIYIGHINASASAKLRGKIYNFEVVGKAKFIPCYRKSDEQAGMYEMYSKTFYPATGTLTLGNKV